MKRPNVVGGLRKPDQIMRMRVVSNVASCKKEWLISGFPKEVDKRRFLVEGTVAFHPRECGLSLRISVRWE